MDRIQTWHVWSCTVLEHTGSSWDTLIINFNLLGLLGIVATTEIMSRSTTINRYVWHQLEYLTPSTIPSPMPSPFTISFSFHHGMLWFVMFWRDNVLCDSISACKTATGIFFWADKLKRWADSEQQVTWLAFGFVGSSTQIDWLMHEISHVCLIVTGGEETAPLRNVIQQSGWAVHLNVMTMTQRNNRSSPDFQSDINWGRNPRLAFDSDPGDPEILPLFAGAQMANRNA